jgi:hypothetical protein
MNMAAVRSKEEMSQITRKPETNFVDYAFVFGVANPTVYHMPASSEVARHRKYKAAIA